MNTGSGRKCPLPSAVEWQGRYKQSHWTLELCIQCGHFSHNKFTLSADSERLPATVRPLVVFHQWGKVVWKVQAKEKIKYSPALQAHLSLIVAQSLLNHGNFSVTKCRKVQAGARPCIHNQTYSPTQYKLTGWFHHSSFRITVMSKGVLMIIVEDGKNCAQSLSYQQPAGYNTAGNLWTKEVSYLPATILLLAL